MASAADAALAALDAAQKNLDKTLAQAPSPGWLQPWSPDLVQFLAIGVLLFAFAALILATALLWRSHAPAHHVLRVFGIITILCFSALLLIVGYSNDQLTPIVGLFGAIAGYLLGKDAQTKGET